MALQVTGSQSPSTLLGGVKSFHMLCNCSSELRERQGFDFCKEDAANKGEVEEEDKEEEEEEEEEAEAFNCVLAIPLMALVSSKIWDCKSET